MLVIDAGREAWLNRVVLSCPAFRAIGLISYPVYLWHWPLLVFADAAGYTGSLCKIGIICLTLILSFLTYRYVEVPIRFGRHAGRQSSVPVVSTVLAGMVLTAGLGQLAPLWQREVRSLPPWAVEDYRADAVAGYRQGSCFLEITQTAAQFAPDCDGREASKSPASRPLVMLWGDSHAAHLYQGLLARQRRTDQGFRLAQFTASLCPPIFDIAIAPRRNCRGVANAIEHTIDRIKPDIVIMAASWSWYDKAGLDLAAVTETVRSLRASGVDHVIVVGPMPEWELPLPEILLLNISPGAAALEYLPNSPPHKLDTAIKAAAIAGGARYISAMEALCDDALGCLATASTAHGLEPVAWDREHLTAAGSIAFIDKVWESQVQPELSLVTSLRTSNR
jgi:SGNH domain (fused to AT3 domains)